MAIDLNAEPYNDDFSDTKGFHQILFRPGYSVQARELTQLQSILRDQIKKFGNHIFRHGSIVIPGYSQGDLGVPYVKLESTYNDLTLDLTKFNNVTLVGATSGVKGAVKKVVSATSTDPLTFFMTYVQGGNNGEIAFTPGEDVYVEGNEEVRATIKTGTDATGLGCMAHITAGVYYINGSFVYVEKQSTVLTGLVDPNNQNSGSTKYTSTPHCHVLLKIVETVVDHTTDETLLDNAQGAYNYSAPGADRLKISLELTTLPLSTALTNDYVEIMRYRDGVLEEHAKNARYSELEKSLARRTYDESGDYVVTGLEPILREHLKKDLNEGVFASTAGGDIGKFVVDVTRGKAYIQGFENEKIASTRLIANKARTEAHIKATDINLRPAYGQYMVISDPKGAFSINSSSAASNGGTIIDLYDTAADLSGTTVFPTLTSVTAGTTYSTPEGKLYKATQSGITGPVPPTDVLTTTDVVNANAWVASTQTDATKTLSYNGSTITVDNYIYYADRLYKVASSGISGATPPTHVFGTEVNSSRGEWDNSRPVAVNDTFYYNNRNKEPDLSSLYKVVSETLNPVPAGTKIVTGHFGGAWGGALTTGTSGITISSGGVYNEDPTVLVSDPEYPEGVRATATVTRTGTAITSVSIATSGSGYTRPPVITIVKADTDTGAGGAVVRYTGSITTSNRGVEPVFLGPTALTVTQYVYNASPAIGSGNITATIADTSNLQVGEYITISGATGTQQSKLNGTWVIASIPNGTTFTFYNNSALTAGTYTSGIGQCTTVGRMVNATYWQKSMVVTKGDYIWVPGAANKPHRVYRVDSVASSGSTNGGLSNALGTAAPTHTTPTSVANGNVYLVYEGAPATLQYAGSPTTLTYVGVPAKFRFQGVTGAKVGSARVLSIDYLLGNPGTSAAIYKLWVTDVQLEGYLKSLDEVGSIKYNNNADYAYALTAFKTPVTSGAFVPGEIIVHPTSGRTATAKYWDSATGTLYAYRHNAAVESPLKGDEIRGQTSNTVSVVQSKTILAPAGQPSLLFQLPKEIPNSLRGTDGQYHFNYIVQKELTISTTGGAGSSEEVNPGTILPIEAGSFLAIGEEGVIPNSYFTLSTDGKVVNVSGLDVGAQTIKVYCSVLKANSTESTITPRTKTIDTQVEPVILWTNGGLVSATTSYGGPQKVYYGNNMYVVTTGGMFSDSDPETPPTHTSGSSTNGTVTLKWIGTLDKFNLDKCDVISISSVVDTVGDITNNYTSENGQTDYAYLPGSMVKIPNRPNPSGDFTITYKYYSHSVTGDFFCIDSYTEGATEAIDKKITYQSASTGTTYDLTTVIDFRPTAGPDGLLSGAGASRNDLIISGTTFESPLKYYVPRIDSLVMNQSGEVSIISGTPAEKAVEPTVPPGLLELNRFYVPAFTRSVKDIQVKRMDVQRFTMKDIKEIVNRIERIEEFSSLTAGEVAVTSYEVKDAATGLNRFKSGYLVETFKNPFTIARTTDGEYAASFVGEVLAPPVEELICDLSLVNDPALDNTFVIKGECLMLPYTEAVFAQQPLSSRITNLNPFQIIRWDGVVLCDPPTDFWVETMTLPTIYEKINEVVTIRWNSPVPSVSQTLVHKGVVLAPGQAAVKPVPIQLVAYRITQPDGHSYTTVGAPGKYERTGDARVEVIGQATVNQLADGLATTRAIDAAAKKLGGAGTVITDDVYKQVANARTSDAMQIQLVNTK